MDCLIYINILLSLVMISSAQRDIGNLPTVIETDELPMKDDGHSVDRDRMTSVGNGHLATVVYSDTVYLNGVYNGAAASSHRARIPSELNLRVNFERRKHVYRQYKLDMFNGYWEENTTIAECRVTQRIYAHQFYTRLLVTEISAQRQSAATGNLLIYLNISKGAESEDIRFNNPQSFSGGNWQTSGKTIEAEFTGAARSQVFMYWSLVPPVIHIPSHKSSIKYTFIMSIDSNQQVAKESFESGALIADRNPDHFFNLHKREWNKRWNDGHIQITGNIQLEKLAYSSMYYILSSLPAITSHREIMKYNGISTSGLSQGNIFSLDRGHITSDEEMWILPAILPFHPTLARSLLHYRIDTSGAARKRAQDSGYLGLLFSPNSAQTGLDVSKSPDNARHYVNGEIAFAVRQYISMTRDQLWMQEKGGCDLVKGLAQFWYSRALYNKKSKRYDIFGITPPGKGDDVLIDNNVYTNAVASLSLHYSTYAACICNIDINDYAPAEWVDAAENLHWEYNGTSTYHPPYHKYTGSSNTAVQYDYQELERKHSEILKLGFPLMWTLPAGSREKDLLVYSTAATASTPPMDLSLSTIGWLELNNSAKAHQFFEQSYKKYINDPFKMWSEFPNNSGNRNYMSGMGSYLQTLLYGFGGLRIKLEQFEMNPQLPRGVNSINYKGLDYLGSSFDIRITKHLVHITVNTIGIYPLTLTLNNTKRQFQLVAGSSIPVERGPFVIKSNLSTGCALPSDEIKEYTQASDRVYYQYQNYDSYSMRLEASWTILLNLLVIISVTR